MGLLGVNVLTLADWAKRIDPTGKIGMIVELLKADNEILDDILWIEGNLPTGHRSIQRVGLPTVAYRKLNAGVPNSKSRTIQIDDACGTLEGYAEVDKDLADLNGNTNEFRLSEAVAFMESMGQAFATQLFYGDTLNDPEKILGLAPRYSNTSAGNGGNIITGTGTESVNTSIWVVAWGANRVHGIFPKGSSAGMMHENKGQVTLQDDDGYNYEGYRDHFQWKNGLALPDWRYAVRISNLLASAVAAGTESLDQYLIRAFAKLPNGASNVSIYCNEETKTALDLMANTNLMESSTDKTSFVGLNIQEFGGKMLTTFRGVPVKKCDAILNTEAVVATS